MTRAQRHAHRAIWWVLAPAIAAALAWSLVDRWHIPPSERPAVLANDTAEEAP